MPVPKGEKDVDRILAALDARFAQQDGLLWELSIGPSVRPGAAHKGLARHLWARSSSRLPVPRGPYRP